MQDMVIVYEMIINERLLPIHPLPDLHANVDTVSRNPISMYVLEVAGPRCRTAPCRGILSLRWPQGCRKQSHNRTPAPRNLYRS
jgi:hypothetical protein